MFLLVAHFRLEAASGDPVPVPAREPLALLAGSPECRRLYFARSTEAGERYVLVAEFDSAATYRRSMSPWPMRTQVIPWLSTAEVEDTAVSEVLYSSVDNVAVTSEPTVPEPGC